MTLGQAHRHLLLLFPLLLLVLLLKSVVMFCVRGSGREKAAGIGSIITSLFRFFHL